MTYFRKYDEPFYSGTVTSVVGAATTPYDVVINGRPYMIDFVNQAAPPYGFDSVPMLQSMFLQDRGTVPIGEHSLSPHDYWRRSVDDWAAGAGQIDLDHTASVNNRFRMSKGINCWTPGQLGLLPDTAQKLSSANATCLAVVAGTYLYLLDGTALKYTTDLSPGSPSFTTVTAAGSDIALSAVVDIASDGYTIWVADGARVHYTTRGAATFAPYHTTDHICTLLRAAKSRLFSANGPTLYTHTLNAGTSAATSYFTHGNTDWAWTAITGGPDAIYFSGYSGDKSAIYGATIKTDGTALDAPAVVASLPTGEIVRSMRAYLSVLVIGTDKGFRIATMGGSAGQLILGSLIAMSNAPTCFESQDRFVWFGWTNYDSTSTGLGRMDLSVFNGDAPAYASDLMVTTQGAVTSVVTFGGLRVFTVAAHGLYAESANKVASGTVSGGWLNYALADPKVAIKLNTQYRVGQGSFVASLAADDQATVQVGNTVQTSAIAGNSISQALAQVQAHVFEVTYALSRSATDTTQGPVIDRSTLMVEPAPERRAIFTVPLQLHTSMRDRAGAAIHFSPITERAIFYTLLQNRSIVPFQDFEQNYSVIVDDFKWVPYQAVGTGNRSWDGTLVVMLKVVA